jgi:hypothetical protein
MVGSSSAVPFGDKAGHQCLPGCNRHVNDDVRRSATMNIVSACLLLAALAEHGGTQLFWRCKQNGDHPWQICWVAAYTCVSDCIDPKMRSVVRMKASTPDVEDDAVIFAPLSTLESRTTERVITSRHSYK